MEDRTKELQKIRDLFMNILVGLRTASEEKRIEILDAICKMAPKHILANPWNVNDFLEYFAIEENRETRMRRANRKKDDE